MMWETTFPRDAACQHSQARLSAGMHAAVVCAAPKEVSPGQRAFPQETRTRHGDTLSLPEPSAAEQQLWGRGAPAPHTNTSLPTRTRGRGCGGFTIQAGSVRGGMFA